MTDCRQQNTSLPRILWYSLAALCLAISLGCTSLPNDQRLGARITTADLLAGEPILNGQPMPALPSEKILAVDADMAEFLDAAIGGSSHPEIQLRKLVKAIIDDESFGLSYTTDTRTAAETFAARDGNCLSFTNMFVAMARHLDLEAYYQEVDVPPLWDQRGDTMVLNRHINVYVETLTNNSISRTGARVVDFNFTDSKSIYKNRVVGDDRAEAHYYSNLGVERLQEGAYLEAFVNLRKGLDLDAGFAALWTNLGALYSRVGRLDYAESSYLTALRHDRNSMVSVSNLANLYERQGEHERAQLFRDRVARYRARNPYYRYYMAQKSIRDGDYPAAFSHLKYAIRTKPEEDLFYFLMGVAHLQSGNLKAARNFFNEARQVAADDNVKRRYADKIEKLMGKKQGDRADA